MPQITASVQLVLDEALGGARRIMNKVLLGLIFYVIFTIVATIMRLQKRDALRRHKDPQADSFWRLRPATPTPAERYERQF
ncbi:MAG: hypothetical protein R3E12_12195 [Candidatus Eisenbacteria bacterium]